jgi:hypothetical protein
VVESARLRSSADVEGREPVRPIRICGRGG